MTVFSMLLALCLLVLAVFLKSALRRLKKLEEMVEDLTVVVHKNPYTDQNLVLRLDYERRVTEMLTRSFNKKIAEERKKIWNKEEVENEWTPDQYKHRPKPYKEHIQRKPRMDAC